MPWKGRPIIDVTGQRFGRLVVLRRITAHGEQARWECRCDCGNIAQSDGYQLRRGYKRSCGCLIKEAATRKTANGIKPQFPREYSTWSQAKARCYDINHPGYPRYGARGITMCERWRTSFRAFLADLGPRPFHGATLDRINNDGPYAPENCRWATLTEQANNRRSNTMLTWRGETHTCAEWATIVGISRGAIYQRLTKGWSVERSLTEPASRLRRP